MMIPENMSTKTSSVAITNVGSKSNNAEGQLLSNSGQKNIMLDGVNKTTATTVNAINSNTFVVKLKPSMSNGTLASTPGQGPKTNLLQLICGENRTGKSISLVKALGLGRIVVNRAQLNGGKKPPQDGTKHLALQKPLNIQSAKSKSIRVSIPTLTESRKMSTADGRMVRLSANPGVKRTLGRVQNGTTSLKENSNSDLQDNLTSFINFKLSTVVPTSMKEADENTVVPVTDSLKVRNEATGSQNDAVSPLKPKIGWENVNGANQNDDDDNDLTSLSWLTGNDKFLKKTIRLCNPDQVGLNLSGDESEEEDSDGDTDHKAVFTAKTTIDGFNHNAYSAKPYSPTGSYNPNGKPPYSFSCLIFMAIEDSSEKKLPVKDIYSWVCRHFPYFRTAPTGWKNSIRHNLSLNKCFKKADIGSLQEPGKGSLWCIDPAYRPNLIQALKRTPFYPYLYPSGVGQPLSLNNLANLLPGVFCGKIPSWAPGVTPNSNVGYADPDVASAALNLMGLKGNDVIENQPPNVRSTVQELANEIFGHCDNVTETVGTIPLVITSPSEDHTYTASKYNQCPTPESDRSAPDAAYEFETCGTDSKEEYDSTDTDEGNHNKQDLADSGFSSASRKLRRNKPRNLKRKQAESPEPTRKRVNHKKATTRHPRGKKLVELKVRFLYGKRETKKSREVKKRDKIDIYPSSDGDSGKDSPKVITKSRRRISNNVTPQKNKKPEFKTTPILSSPCGTRSSKRLMAKKMARERTPRDVKRRRSGSISNEQYDDEITRAAGSLLHLAGFRSPQDER